MRTNGNEYTYVTSNKYEHALHWTILHREYNSTIFGSVRKYASKVIM